MMPGSGTSYLRTALAGLGLAFGCALGAAADQAGLIPQVLPHSAAEPGLQTLREAWEVVQAHYVDHQTLEPSRLSYAAISGLLKSLGDGEHTRLLTPTELRAQADGLAGR